MLRVLIWTTIRKPQGLPLLKSCHMKAEAPLGMLGAAVQAYGLFCARHEAVLGCMRWPYSWSLPQGAHSTDITLLLAAAYLIFMHSNARECPNTSCSQRCRAAKLFCCLDLLFPCTGLLLGWSGLLPGDGTKLPGWCLGCPCHLSLLLPSTEGGMP